VCVCFFQWFQGINRSKTVFFYYLICSSRYLTWMILLCMKIIFQGLLFANSSTVWFLFHRSPLPPPQLPNFFPDFLCIHPTSKGLISLSAEFLLIGIGINSFSVRSICKHFITSELHDDNACIDFLHTLSDENFLNGIYDFEWEYKWLLLCMEDTTYGSKYRELRTFFCLITKTGM